MAIISTPAIILRRIEHSETSLICTFYTRNYGKLTAIAKGARRPKSQFAGLLDLMNYLHIVVHVKETRNVQTLSSAEYQRPFLRIQQDMRRTAIGMILIETIRQAIIGEEPHPEIFDLSIAALSFLNDEDRADIETLWWFHLHLVSLLGYHPKLQFCHECEQELRSGAFSSQSGHIYCERCSTRQSDLTALGNLELRMARYLQNHTLRQLDLDAIHRTILSPSGSQESDRPGIHPLHFTGVIVKYLQYHVEGIGTLRSMDFFTTLN